MDDTTVKLLIAAFDDEGSAGAALKQLKSDRKKGQVEYRDIAVVRRDEKDRLHVKETADPKAGQGALAGSLTGAVLGLLAGPAGLVAGGIVGAFAGAGMAAPDTGIPDERLAEIGRAVSPGTSAIVILSDSDDLDPLRKHLDPGATEVFTAEINVDIAEQLAIDHDVAPDQSSSTPGEPGLQVDPNDV